MHSRAGFTSWFGLTGSWQPTAVARCSALKAPKSGSTCRASCPPEPVEVVARRERLGGSGAVVRGQQAYYAVPGNSGAVNAFRIRVIRHWREALQRRSQRTRITWARMNRIATRWIPQTRTVHPFPQARSPPRTQGRS